MDHCGAGDHRSADTGMVRWRRGANPPDRPGNFLAGAALMPRWLVMSVAATALCASLAIAQDAPESLLPPGFDDPAPPPPPPPPARPQSTEERPAGNVCVRTGNSRWTP